MVRNAQMWAGLFWLAIGGYVTWTGLQLDLGSLHDPGSGFALFWIGLIMTGLAAVVVAQAIAHGSETVASLWAGTRWGKVLTIVVILLVFGFLFERIGFLVCAMVLLLVLFLLIDPIPARAAVPIAVLSTFIVWSMLTVVLKIQLPAGIIQGPIEDALRVFASTLIHGLVAMVSWAVQLISAMFR